MTRILVDTSCLIALLCSWHEQHVRTRKFLESSMSKGTELILAAHSLAEAYSILTRLPYPYRLSETDAIELFNANWDKTRIVALSAREYRRVLRGAAKSEIGGGQIYDALIAACARKGKAKTVVTWNLNDFMAFQDGGLLVVSP